MYILISPLVQQMEKQTVLDRKEVRSTGCKKLLQQGLFVKAPWNYNL
jgi:hypothetical protein